MSAFKAKMYQIQFRLGLCPDPAGELTALPRPLAGFQEATSKGREGKGLGMGLEKGKGRRGGNGRGRVAYRNEDPLNKILNT